MDACELYREIYGAAPDTSSADFRLFCLALYLCSKTRNKNATPEHKEKIIKKTRALKNTSKRLGHMQIETTSNLKHEIIKKESTRQTLAADMDQFLKQGNQITVVPGFTTVSRPQSVEEKRLASAPKSIRTVAFVLKRHKGRAEA